MRFRVVVREEALSASRTVIHACTGSAPRTKRAFAEASRSLVVCGFLGVAMLASPGCASAHGESPLVDPDAFGSDLGTLISIADVRRVSDEMIQAMNASDTLAELRRAPPLSIRLGLFRQFTTITNFNKRLFTNRLVAELKRATGDASIRFFEPLESSDPLIISRTGDPAPGPTDLVLDGEVRELLSFQPHDSGGEIRTRTVQYALRLVRPEDRSIVWAHTHEIVKSQVIGVVYR